jgi:hypothetical protein
MHVPPEFAAEFATFPEPLRQLVEAELQAGNAITAIEHGFPAAPCGASLKLAQAVKDERRKSGADVQFYARNNPSYAGEFTTESRHFFVLEPPLPPEPEPDLDAIRRALEPKPGGSPRPSPRPAEPSSPKPKARSAPASTGARRRGKAVPVEEPAPAPQALVSTETATSATRVLHFRDHRPPHEIQFALERSLMTLFAPAMKDGRLTLTTRAVVVGSPYDLELRFEAALPRTNAYSLRVETSWATQPETNHDYCRKSAGSWFDFWTRDFVPADPPPAEADPSERYQRMCAASLNAEAHLDSVSAIQQTIVAAMKRGAGFSTSHKEGGTHLRWTDGSFRRSDYGDDPDTRVYSSEAEFLEALGKFYAWQLSGSAHPKAASEFTSWKLILRLLRNS